MAAGDYSKVIEAANGLTRALAGIEIEGPFKVILTADAGARLAAALPQYGIDTVPSSSPVWVWCVVADVRFEWPLHAPASDEIS